MINWFQLLANSLWIFALALALTVVGYTQWEKSMWKGRFRDLVNRSPRAILISLVGALFCLGLALVDQAWWERLLWGILVVLFAAQTWMARSSPDE